MFYIIDASKNLNLASTRLVDACKKLEVECEILNPENFDHTKYSFSKNDSCYRVEVGQRARLVAKYLQRQNVRFLRRLTSDQIFRDLDVFTVEEKYIKNNVQIIPTEHFPSRHEELLIKQVEAVGGFPVIVKENGGSSGSGVVKTDSLSSLISVLGVMLKKASGNVVLKQYIEHDEQARIVVLGDKVVGQKANIKNGEEIRLNTGANFTQEARDYPEYVQEMAIKATNLLGLEFAGVDILVGNDGKYYVAEVNIPCAFTYVEDVAGVDIAGQIVEYLTAKEK